MDLKVPIPGGGDCEQDENEEVVPFTPRDGESSSSSASSFSAVTGNSNRTKGNFLSYFLSPPAVPVIEPRFQDVYSADNRTRTPLYTLSGGERNTSSRHPTRRNLSADRDRMYRGDVLSTAKERARFSLESYNEPAMEEDLELGAAATFDEDEESHGGYVPSYYNLSGARHHAALVRTPGSSIRSMASFVSSRSSASSVSSRSSVSTRSPQNRLSIISSASHLFGESLISPNYSDSRVSVASFQDHHPWNAILNTVVDDIKLIGRTAHSRLLNWREPPAPLSPRSRNLSDLRYLTQQHKSKVQQLSGGNCIDKPLECDGGHYDFCLVLQSEEVYAYWSTLLDFRAELLGQEVVDTMEANWSTLYDTRSPNHASPGEFSGSYSTDETTSASSNESEAMDVLESMSSTPGIRRRAWSQHTETSHTPHQMSSSTVALARPSPGLYSLADCSRMSARLSVFDRAMGATTASQASSSSTIEQTTTTSPTAQTTQQQETIDGGTVMTSRRRWGNHAVVGGTPQVAAMSPPIRSLTRGSSTIRRPTVARLPIRGLDTSIQEEQEEEEETTTDPNLLRMEDIPNQVIPRGIAARTNGMLSFLSALKRGIVLRRHRPGQEAIFCKMISHDGGDTIQYQPVDEKDAMQAFKEQRVRYNRLPSDETASADVIEAQPWSYEPDARDVENEPNNHFTVPDYVAAQQYREKMSRKRGFVKATSDLANTVIRSGSIRAADIVAVHPARFHDPREFSSTAFGTATLRRSKSGHSSQFSFSVVMRSGHPLARGANIDELEDKWHKGEGSDAQFRYIDFEAATEGEYWLIFRGLLLLHRDAAVGRFAEQRAAGIGSHYRRLELEQREQLELTAHNQLHQDEFHEPVTVGCLEKIIVKWRGLDPTYMEGYTLPGAVPPPSDYFLGFKSSGTAIWSRLRQAGLQTQRVYSLDPRRVLIKIRCPSDRLLDVAEVLRLKLKTRDGSFAPFREDMVDLYEDINDPLEIAPTTGRGGFQFRSSFRQTIIDFIIGSRIRDSGAELGQTTDLGKKIEARVPLHMHAKLDAIYRSWFFFWRKENWEGRDGRSMTHPQPTSDDETVTSGTSSSENSSSTVQRYPVPVLLKRLFVGCLYQPLDSIEQYFGEKVAFYFAWLQHTSSHLVVLSVPGLLLFICQLASGDWDHWLRPFYAVTVMMWTFIVLVNWRKRANFLAYRWGTIDYKEQETTRPQFHGDYTRDEITNEWVVKYPKWKRWLKYAISFPLTLLFTGGTLVVILWVHANRDIQLANYVNRGSEEFEFDFGIRAIGQKRETVQIEMKRAHFRDSTFWFIVVGMPSMLGLFLPLLNFILMKLSVMLNDFENYRTESEYRSFLIIKVFSFRFVCYFATLYYYCFVSVGDKPGDKQAIENGILRVGTGVLVYTTVAQWWQTFLHVCFPIMIRKLRLRHREKRLIDELREIEVEEEEISRLSFKGTTEDLKMRQTQLINKRLLLEQAQDDAWLELLDPPHDSFPEYIQAVVQFTFVSCFSVVLPITPLIVLINYLMNMRLDAYKLCKCRRRPLAEKTGGIGVWEHLLHIVAVISVLTNCWLMGFTSSQFTWIGEQVGVIALFAIVVAWEHIMLLIKYVMQTTISPLPKSVRDAMKREQYEINQQRNSSMMARRLQHQREEDKRGEEENT